MSNCNYKLSLFRVDFKCGLRPSVNNPVLYLRGAARRHKYFGKGGEARSGAAE